MASWKAFAARIDAQGLRERVFLFLALILICVAVADAWWVSPERLRHQQARLQFDANTLELQRLRDESRLNTLKPNPAQQARDELVRVLAQIDTTNRQLEAAGAGARATTSLSAVLRHFLRRYPALSLVRTSSISVETANAARPALVSREGLELVVAGPYTDLVRFVQALEVAMPDLRWGSLKLQAEQQPPELALQVFLVGVRP